MLRIVPASNVLPLMYAGVKINTTVHKQNRKRNIQRHRYFIVETAVGKTTWSSENPKTNHYDEMNTRRLTGNNLELVFVRQTVAEETLSLSLSLSYRGNYTL